MNIYLLLVFGYMLPALILIGATMLRDDELRVLDILVSLLPIINIIFSVFGVVMLFMESDFTQKVIWRKK